MELARQTGMHRTALYDVLENVMQKGLASFVFEGKRKLFCAAKPERLLGYVQELQERLQQEKEQLRDVVDVLSSIEPLRKERLSVEVFRGKKGVKTVLEDVFSVCKRGDEVLAFGFGGSNLFKVLGPYYHRYIMRSIHDFGLFYRAISDPRDLEQEYVRYLKKLPRTQVKYVLRGVEAPAHTRIYGGKVAIILIEKDPTAILIDDEKVAAGYRQFFEFLWGLTDTA